jgi:hypothetical protein
MNRQLRSWAAKGIMNGTFVFRKQFLLGVAVVVCFSGAPQTASAQVVPAGRSVGDVAVFATFTDAKPNFRYLYDRAVYGFSAGGYLQTRHVVGIEVRGSLLKWGSDQHEESALAGPRAALHLGRFSPYTSGLVGIGNAWSRNLNSEPSLITEATGLQWSILGGVDFHLAHHLRLRVGEVAYSKIYLSGRTLSPLNASAGFVYRIN